jgi:hypothetical protein
VSRLPGPFRLQVRQQTDSFFSGLDEIHQGLGAILQTIVTFIHPSIDGYISQERIFLSQNLPDAR